MNTKLDQEVLDLLKARKGDWPAVVVASGVSYSWLSKFVNGHITNPGYGTLVRLHAVLQAPLMPTPSANQALPATECVAVPANFIDPGDALRAGAIRRHDTRRNIESDDHRANGNPAFQNLEAGVA